MNKKRNSLEIIHDILKVIDLKKGNIKPTHILYKSNLSTNMLKSYLSELETKGFIKEKTDKNGRKTYELTELGSNYLKEYSVIKSFTNSFGLN